MLVIILLDPLPTLLSSKDSVFDDDDDDGILPFHRAYSRAPFGQDLGMVGIFKGGEQLQDKLSKLGPYLKDTNSTKADITNWIDSVEVFSPKDTELDPAIGLLWVIHRDITGFLTLVSNVLIEIGLGSADDYLMQSRLSHWRSLIIRFQIELPEIKASLDGFVRFICEYQSLDIAAPFIKDTFAQLDILIEQNEKSYSALRDDMALLENKRAIAQAESVNRLTELGFIFIPITAVAGIFSMQIEQLSSPVSLQSFIIGAIVAVVVAYILRFILHTIRLANLKREHYKRIEERADLLPDDLALGLSNLSLTLPHWLSNKKFGIPKSLSSKLLNSGPRIPVLSFLSIAILSIPITLIWTHQHLDSGFKSILTVLVFILNATIVGIFYVLEGKRYSLRTTGTTSTMTSGV